MMSLSPISRNWTRSCQNDFSLDLVGTRLQLSWVGTRPGKLPDYAIGTVFTGRFDPWQIRSLILRIRQISSSPIRPINDGQSERSGRKRFGNDQWRSVKNCPSARPEPAGQSRGRRGLAADLCGCEKTGIPGISLGGICTDGRWSCQLRSAAWSGKAGCADSSRI